MPTPRQHSLSAGGYDFPADPQQRADSASLSWLPALSPDTIELRQATDRADDPAAMPVDLTSLANLNLRAAVDGAWHGAWRLADAAHQFWFLDAPSVVASSYVVMLPLDALTELRVEAVQRFWRALVGRSAGPRHFDLPPQTRRRHVLILRALDGRTEGASYRKIAEVLLGFQGSKADWESDPRKNQARRLVADGLHYEHGGYRDLLHYPVRLQPQR